MSFAFSRIGAARTLVTVVCLAGAAAQAQTLVVDCTVWDTRSRILANATELGDSEYRVKVVSTQQHHVRSPLESAVDGDADFHFDSKKSEIAAGATKISRSFIVHDKVTAYLLDQTGFVLQIAEQKCHDHSTDGSDDSDE